MALTVSAVVTNVPHATFFRRREGSLRRRLAATRAKNPRHESASNVLRRFAHDLCSFAERKGRLAQDLFCLVEGLGRASRDRSGLAYGL